MKRRGDQRRNAQYLDSVAMLNDDCESSWILDKHVRPVKFYATIGDLQIRTKSNLGPSSLLWPQMETFTRTVCLILIFIVVTVFAGDPCYDKGKVSYYPSKHSMDAGAWRYGTYGATVNGGHVAGASAKFYGGGAICGACYEAIPNHCLPWIPWVKVVVTDLNQSNQTDFVLPFRTFCSLARTGRAAALVKEGIVDVEYKRIFCEYRGHNLTINIEESSKYPYYLALKFLYQGGQTQILTVAIYKAGFSDLHYMTRTNSAVWALENPPEGSLSLQIAVTSGFDPMWLSKDNVLPAKWKAGDLFDSGFQITAIDKGATRPCQSEDKKKFSM
eukprot:Gb_10705 [translate_table: standard]